MILDTSKPVDCTGNGSCGPLVCAAILGTSTGKVAETIANMRSERDPATVIIRKGGKARVRRMPKGVRGTFHTELHAILERAGYILTTERSVHAPLKAAHSGVVYVNPEGTRMQRLHPVFLPPTDWAPWTLLRQNALPLWLAALRLTDGVFVVHLPGHYAIAADGKWCETLTSGEWVPLRNAPSNRRKVLTAWRVTRAEGVTS